eukprot:8849826-Karenia_brevis.AAC.1
MAYQPNKPECRKKFEETLENEAKVRNQRARMEEFEGREKRRKEKKESKKEEEHKRERNTGVWKGEESRDSGGSSGSESADRSGDVDGPNQKRKEEGGVRESEGGPGRRKQF